MDLAERGAAVAALPVTVVTLLEAVKHAIAAVAVAFRAVDVEGDIDPRQVAACVRDIAAGIAVDGARGG